MIIRLKQQRGIRVLIVMLVTTGALFTGGWLLSAKPPDFSANHRHVEANFEVFSRLKSYLANEPDISRISVEPEQILNIESTNDASSVELDELEFEELIRLMLAAKIEYVSKQPGYVEFHGGSERKFGDIYEVRVIAMGNLANFVNENGIESCNDIHVLFTETSSCIDMLNENWAIFYIWSDS